MAKAIVGVIGGSGVYHLPGLTDLREEQIATPWGEPSELAPLRTCGANAGGVPRPSRPGPSLLSFDDQLPRQYRRAERVGVTDIIALSACGSFHRELYPGMFVMIDQFVDRTYRRQTSFFGDGCVAHVSMAHPIAPLLRRRLVAAAQAENVPSRDGGTTFASKVRSFRRWPSRSVSRRAAPMSSA